MMMPTETNLQNPDGMEQEDQQLPDTDDQPKEIPIRAMLESVNIADKLDEELLNTIGSEAKRGYEADKESRKDWEKDLDEWTKLATQVREQKSFPWRNASNIKYPLLTTAAMQFAARAYPSLLPSDGRVVKGKVIGKDPTGDKLSQAERVSMYMSYQLLQEMDGWEEGMDKLLIMLPVAGTVFKKTYWDKDKEVPVSEVILPKDVVVNYWAKSLKEAERISHYIEMSPRKLKERQLAKTYRTVELGSPVTPDKTNAPSNDETTPYCLVEQHTFLDLDKDGYKEPYVVTFELASAKVLRIVARFDEKGIKLDGDKVIRIEPLHYFTKFGFIPNPDGGFYDIGFGSLLGPVNEAVNTVINQLVDSGTLNNLQSGFLGKGLRLRMGEHGFQPGEWKPVNAIGDDLKKQIVPLPSKEPSNVLFQLMGSMISSGKELASVAEIFTGKMPGQNTPATTTMATIEQGMKVFTAVYKRVYRSLAEEFLKLYEINATYLNPETYASVVDVTVGPEDFTLKTNQIYPGADPTAISQTEKLMKAQGLMELIGTGMLDPVKVVSRVLEAQEQPNWEELLSEEVRQTGKPPPPAPDPKVQALQAKSQLDAAAGQQKMEMAAAEEQRKAAGDMQRMKLEGAERQQKIVDAARLAQVKLAAQLQNNKAKIITAAATGQQKLVQNQQAHQQKMQQVRQQPKGGSKSK